jgi:hypothetical protein
MHAPKYGFGNAQRDIATPPAEFWARLAEGKHTRLILKDFAHLASAELPHLRDFRN